MFSIVYDGRDKIFTHEELFVGPDSRTSTGKLGCLKIKCFDSSDILIE